MPSINRRVCSKCQTIYTTKYCESCKKQTAKIYNQQSRNKESAKIYQSTQWRKLRLQQLTKEPLCINFHVCHNSTENSTMIADHIKEIASGGEAYSIDNLQSICLSCHNTKTAKEKRDRQGMSKSYRL